MSLPAETHTTVPVQDTLEDLIASATDLLEPGRAYISLEDVMAARERPTLERRPIWERMEGEGVYEYRSFLAYLAEPLPRRWSKARKTIGCTMHKLRLMAGTFFWEARADAWDDYQDAAYHQTYARTVREMASRHASQTSEALEALTLPARALLNRIEADGGDEDLLAELAAGDPRKLMSLVIRAAQVAPNVQNAERLARGQPTQIIAEESHVTVDLGADTRERLAGVVFALGLSGALDDRLGIDRAPTPIDATVVEIHPEDEAERGALPAD